MAREASIEAAKLALGTSYRVADRAERDALTDLTLNDTVRVLDDGDGKWVGRVFRPLIDALFLPFERDHCQTAYLSELRGLHLPPEYQSEVQT